MFAAMADYAALQSALPLGQTCHPREGGDQVRRGPSVKSLPPLEYWIPAFAGMTVGICGRRPQDVSEKGFQWLLCSVI